MRQMQKMADMAQAQSVDQIDSSSQSNKMACSHCNPCWAACSFAVISSPQNLLPGIISQRQRFPDLIQTLRNAPVHTLERPPRA
jgi:Fe-S-cluster-containing hydrogenase component 2